MRSASTDEQFGKLNGDEAVLINTFNIHNRDAACEMALIHHSLIMRKLKLDIVPLTPFLKEHRHLWFSEILFPRQAEVKITGEDLVRKSVQQKSADTCNLDDKQQQAFSWFKQYVRYLPDK